MIILDLCDDRYADHKALFKSFSHLVTKLRLSCDYQPDEVENPIEYLTTYPCDSLKYLELSLKHYENGVVLDNNATKEKLKQLFSRLNHLEIDNGNLLDSQTTKELLSSCSELESITARSLGMYKNIHFPKLRKLKLQFYKFKGDDFETMLAFNRGIRKLEFRFSQVTPKILTIITRYLPNLEKISIDQFSSFGNDNSDHLDELRKLKHLKSLKICQGNLSTSALDGILAAGIPIESLELSDINDDEVIKTNILKKVLTIKSLKKMELGFTNICDKYLKELAKELPYLSKLRLKYTGGVTINGLKIMLLHAKNLMFLDMQGLCNAKKSEKRALYAFINQHCGGRDIKINIIE